MYKYAWRTNAKKMLLAKREFRIETTSTQWAMNRKTKMLFHHQWERKTKNKIKTQREREKNYLSFARLVFFLALVQYFMITRWHINFFVGWSANERHVETIQTYFHCVFVYSKRTWRRIKCQKWLARCAGREEVELRVWERETETKCRASNDPFDKGKLEIYPGVGRLLSPRLN